MHKYGIDPKNHFTTGKFVGSVAFKVDLFRSRKFLVGYDPILNKPPYPDNPCHGGVWQDNAGNSKLTKGVRKALLREAEWNVQIQDVSLV